jgi:hypothetical protein
MKADSTQPIATPVRAIETGLFDVDGHGIIYKFCDYAGEDNKRVRDYIALCINEHESLAQQVADLKAEVARLREERDREESLHTKWASWFDYTAGLLGVEPTQKAVQDAIQELQSLSGALAGKKP